MTASEEGEETTDDDHNPMANCEPKSSEDTADSDLVESGTAINMRGLWE